MVVTAFKAFLAFCILAGSIYTFNDIVDREQDSMHPFKVRRPVASGIISPKEATVFGVFLSILAITSGFFINNLFGILLCLYLFFQIAYSFYFKNQVIIDVLLVSFGFVLRAIGGAVAIKVFISPWLIICTFLLALFLALSKRKYEYGSDLFKHRKVLVYYNDELLDQMIAISTSSVLVSYILYTFTSGKPVALMYTIPFVIYGIFRYIYLVYKENEGGRPAIHLLTDLPLQINLLLWIGVVIFIFYFHR